MTPLRLSRIEPVAVLAAAKRAAIAADWRLAQWDEFSRTARACLTADCEPEEMQAFMDVVRSHFDVTASETSETWDHAGQLEPENE